MRRILSLLLLLGLCSVGAAQERIVISGASGQLGGLVIDELLARKVSPESLILVSRTPETLQGYEARGASVRFGDFSKPESLAEAYNGGTKMLLISIGGTGGQRPEMHKAAIDAAVAAGIKQIAYTSYVYADQYTSSILAPDHRRTEQFLKDSGVAWTMLRNNIYANGLVEQAAQIVRDGKLVTHLPDARVAYVTREDCAAAAAAVLATPGHENRTYNITGPEAVGPRELVALASEISGKPLQLVELDEQTYVKSLRDAGASEQAIRGTLTFAAELNSRYLSEASTAVAELTGRPATSVRALLLANAAKIKSAVAN